jgi:hypothetical protein
MAIVSTSYGSSPLRVHPQNWRYFTDDSGKAILLAGSHTWFCKIEGLNYLANGWDMDKFEKYLDFLEYWHYNYTRLWMWEHPMDVDIWMKGPDGKYDLSKLNQAYFDIVHKRVQAASDKGIYLGVMLFQGWSGCNSGSATNWAHHPMNKYNNINGIDGDPEEKGYGTKVHALDNPAIVGFQKKYIDKMLETLNGFDHILFEVGNEIATSSTPWRTKIIEYIHESEKDMPKQHLILDGLTYGGSNDEMWVTGADVFSPGALKKWSSHDEIYVLNPLKPDCRLKIPIILDNDHIGNHFLSFTPLEQRSWTWKAFCRGNNVLHMDNYDVFWDGEEVTPDHPIKGVATNPHFDPQRKSLGDILEYAAKVNLANMIPVTDTVLCSTSFCLKGEKEYIVYQPDVEADIFFNLDKGNYTVESFDTSDNSVEFKKIKWKGGRKAFNKPSHVQEDWVLLIAKVGK